MIIISRDPHRKHTWSTVQAQAHSPTGNDGFRDRKLIKLIALLLLSDLLTLCEAKKAQETGNQI